jgi:hypothetical protein
MLKSGVALFLGVLLNEEGLASFCRWREGIIPWHIPLILSNRHQAHLFYAKPPEQTKERWYEPP